jgi:hypothetical protein
MKKGQTVPTLKTFFEFELLNAFDAVFDFLIELAKAIAPYATSSATVCSTKFCASPASSSASFAVSSAKRRAAFARRTGFFLSRAIHSQNRRRVDVL